MACSSWNLQDKVVHIHIDKPLNCNIDNILRSWLHHAAMPRKLREKASLAHTIRINEESIFQVLSAGYWEYQCSE